MMTGRAYGRALMGAIGLIAMGCNADDAPPCLKAAGELETHHFTFQQPLEVLNTEGHMQVSYETWDSSAVAVSWEVHSNLLSDTRMEWDGAVLDLSFEEACQWTRDLSNVVKVRIRSPFVPKFILRGQGECDIQSNLEGASVFIDAYAYAGELKVACEADTLQVRLHDGVCLAELTGSASRLGCYSSGYCRVDASLVSADQAYITQSGIQPLHFQAFEYAYVAIESAGDVYGGWIPPEAHTLDKTGSGELKWERQ